MKQKITLLKNDTSLSYQKCCLLLNLNRSTAYYKPVALSKQNTDLMNIIHEIWHEYPFLGYRKISIILKNFGLVINHKKVLRLMREMNIQAIYPKKRHKSIADNKIIYPYLLEGVSIDKPNQVWSTDLTYLRMQQGFMYLIAIVDIFSRYIISWKLLNTMEANDCIEVLKTALLNGKPAIFNSDQGSQFRSNIWVDYLLKNDIKISMSGKGRCFDNIHIERLWRTIKYEDFYLNCYQDGWSLEAGLERFVLFYNTRRPHQALNYKTPANIYLGH